MPRLRDKTFSMRTDAEHLQALADIASRMRRSKANALEVLIEQAFCEPWPPKTREPSKTDKKQTVGQPKK